MFNAGLVRRLNESGRREDEVVRGPKKYKKQEEAKQKFWAKVALFILIGSLAVILVACIWGCLVLFTSERTSKKHCNQI